MLILGIDSSSKTASAAVFDGAANKVLSEVNSGGNISHSENLLPMIDYALKTAGISVGDIDLFAVVNGPGSFTGIRIGVATVKGLAFGGTGNCLAVSSLHALAYNFAGLDNLKDVLILPVIDARRRQVYNAVFAADLEYITRDRIITIDELEEELNNNAQYAGKTVMFTGDGAEMCRGEIKTGGVKIKTPAILQRPSAGSLCAAALREYKQNGAVGADKLVPAYLIKTQAEREYKDEK